MLGVVAVYCCLIMFLWHKHLKKKWRDFIVFIANNKDNNHQYTYLVKVKTELKEEWVLGLDLLEDCITVDLSIFYTKLLCSYYFSNYHDIILDVFIEIVTVTLLLLKYYPYSIGIIKI